MKLAELERLREGLGWLILTKLGIVKLFHVGVMESDPAFKNVIGSLSWCHFRG